MAPDLADLFRPAGEKILQMLFRRLLFRILMEARYLQIPLPKGFRMFMALISINPHSRFFPLRFSGCRCGHPHELLMENRAFREKHIFHMHF